MLYGATYALLPYPLSSAFPADPLALMRVVTNLVDNALERLSELSST